MDNRIIKKIFYYYCVACGAHLKFNRKKKTCPKCQYGDLLELDKEEYEEKQS